MSSKTKEDIKRCRSGSVDLHMSILMKYSFPRRRLLLRNLKVGDCSPMYVLRFPACEKLSHFGDLLHVRKQPRNYMMFVIGNQKAFALNGTSHVF